MAVSLPPDVDRSNQVDAVTENQDATPADDSKDAIESAAGQSPPQPPDTAEENTAAKPVDAASVDAANTGDSAAAATADAPADPSEGLPEWEPLTPELVEDEAIRGDFMLRWAAVLLALLFGCTQLNQTETLVHIRAGQTTVSQGGLPPRTDVLSYTANELPWVQLDWLFNVVIAGVYGATAAWGVTLLKAIIAAVTVFLLVHISRPGVSTWWGAICASLFVVAGFRQFSARPELVTLAGLTLTFWYLHQLRTEPSRSIRWKLPLVFLVWANIDPRMFFGLAVMVLFGLGVQLQKLLKRPTERQAEPSVWPVIGLCLAASLLNPYLWNSWTSAWSLFTVEYPAWQAYNPITDITRPEPSRLAYFPLTDRTFWRWVDAPTIATLVLAGLALFSCLVNWKRVDLAFLLPLLGLAGLSVPAAAGLPAVALAAAIVANLNIQQWYQGTFRQTYTVNTSELLFSRGGRALTVLGMVALALWMISGRVDPSGLYRVGLGFHEELANQIDSVIADVEDSFDDRPFNFRLEQGDLLIWAGQKSFVDNRIRVFAQPSDDPIMAQHSRCRQAMISENPLMEGSGKPDVWKEILDRYEVTHVIPRMYGELPNYSTYFDLRTSQDWALTRLGPASAILYRLDHPENLELMQYIEDHQFDIYDEAFQDDQEELVSRVDWARPQDFYERFLSPHKRRSNEQQLARHMLEHIERLQLTPPQTLAYAHRAIRSSNQSLETHSQDALAYQMLGWAYMLLGRSEVEILQQQVPISPVRYLQAVAALQQSATIDPGEPRTQVLLYQLYGAAQRIDVRIDALEAMMKIQGDPARMTTEQFEAYNLQAEERDRLTEQLAEVREQAEKKLAEMQSSLEANGLTELVVAVTQSGCPKLALQILDDHLALIEENPGSMLIRARLMLETGRVEESFEELGKLEAYTERFAMPEYYLPAAAASLGFGDYLRATKIWYDELSTLRRRQQSEMTSGLERAWLLTLPLVSSKAWPLTHIRLNRQIATIWPSEVAEVHLRIAQCHLEAGQIEEAADVLNDILERAPDSAVRPLAAVYLSMITDGEYQLLPNFGWLSPDDPALDAVLNELPPEDSGPPAQGSSTGAADARQPDESADKPVQN